ncbi:hypothetical protein G647_05638 [Cladophialophora carrionii CBS 160.54]|uniref:CENP-V/GFA domain-containing protein n=1 Tax=Cladophialophora carrionii CBS 160.54 TaxID=1279043 RepID=V9DCZ8_9EURO|nr:uncharacterized protein G647_05638 [Cladophialophora carrionii CBS 160.54]ETI23832.1 hypothetical protein G647_05638 [Cladophialophora carrionii CBS 160.54]
MIHGSCACGRIQYKTQAQPLAVTFCHCITCQRVTGAPFLPFVGFPTTAIEWTQQPDLWQASDIAERGHCTQCGSAISMRYFHETDRIGLTLGTLVEAQPALPPVGAHIFLKDRAPYFTLSDDGAERFDEFSPGFRDQIEQWRAHQQKE